MMQLELHTSNCRPTRFNVKLCNDENISIINIQVSEIDGCKLELQVNHAGLNNLHY